MDRLAQIDRDALVRRMREEFERTMRAVADAVNAAADGHLIDGSEERCRDALGEFRRLAYEAAVQMRVEATEADPAFSPAAQSRPRRGVAARSVLTGNGRVTVRRRRDQDASGGTGVPVDDLVDLAGASVSVAAREMCCRAAADGGSFARAAAALGRPAGLRVSDEQLRRVAGSEGRAVVAWQDDGQPELDFDAGTWPAAGPGSAGGPAGGAVASRAYVGVDGFMLPVVTDAEAGRRFDKAVARRKATPRRRGVRRPRLARRPGADQRYKEAKLVVAHDQAKSRRLVRATRTGGVRRAGRCLRQVAADVRLRRAGQVVAVTDGAEWIAGLLATDLPRPTGGGGDDDPRPGLLPRGRTRPRRPPGPVRRGVGRRRRLGRAGPGRPERRPVRRPVGRAGRDPGPGCGPRRNGRPWTA